MRPLVFDPDKVEPWWGRAARAIILGHQFHGVNNELGGTTSCGPT